MTGEYRDYVKHLIDQAVRQSTDWLAIEKRARAAEVERRAEAGYCGECWAELPAPTGRIPGGKRRLFCSDICRKRSHYALDTAVRQHSVKV